MVNILPSRHLPTLFLILQYREEIPNQSEQLVKHKPTPFLEQSNPLRRSQKHLPFHHVLKFCTSCEPTSPPPSRIGAHGKNHKQHTQCKPPLRLTNLTGLFLGSGSSASVDRKQFWWGTSTRNGLGKYSWPHLKLYLTLDFSLLHQFYFLVLSKSYMDYFLVLVLSFFIFVFWICLKYFLKSHFITIFNKFLWYSYM